MRVEQNRYGAQLVILGRRRVVPLNNAGAVVGLTAELLLKVAVAESHFATHVEREGNANRNLAHTNAVRRFGLFDGE